MTVIIRIPARGTAHVIASLLCRASGDSLRLLRSFGIALTIVAFWTTTIGVEIPPVVGTAKRTLPLPDLRAKRLSVFFKAHHCPKPHYVEDYLQAADRYGLDYRLLPAISLRETTCGLAETNNNRWGYHPGRQSFSSVQAGIDFLARQLSTKPPYAGKTLDKKLWTYNPIPAYPEEVRRIMRQIE